MVIGIDPGVTNCGIAKYIPETKTLIQYTGNAYDIQRVISSFVPGAITLAVMEDVNEDSPVFLLPPKATMSVKLMIAQKLGKCKAIQLVLQQQLEHLGIPIELIAPSRRRRVPAATNLKIEVGPYLQAYAYPTKTTAEQFAYLMGIYGVTLNNPKQSPFGTEHSRDAAMLLQKYFQSK